MKNCSILHGRVFVMEAMLNSGMQESISGDIHFKDMDANTFELVLEFIYTGNDDIVSNDNGFALLEAASLLQIQPLFRKCEAILSQNVALDTCVDTLRFASAHNSKQLRMCASKIIWNKFEELVKQEDFMTLNFDELYEIITDNRLKVPSEEFVVKAVTNWGNYSDANANKLGKLFANLRLYQLSSEHLLVLKEYLSTTLDSEIARKSIDKALEYKLFPAGRLTQNSIIARYRYCNPVEDVLVIVGGVKDTAPPDQKVQDLEVLAFSLLKRKWFQLAPMPQSCGFFFATGSTGQSIYITGGTNNEVGMLQYQATLNKWETGTDLRQGRYAHAMATMSESLFILGGCTGKGDDRKVVPSVDKYSFSTKRWIHCGDLVQPVAWPTSTVTGTRVFVYGGLKKEDMDSKSSPYVTSANLVQFFDITTHSGAQITLASSPAVEGAIQFNEHTFLINDLGNVSQYESLDKTPDNVGTVDALRRNMFTFTLGPRHYSLVHMNGIIYVTYRKGDSSHLKKFNPDTWKECRPPVLLPYKRTVEGCAIVTIIMLTSP